MALEKMLMRRFRERLSESAQLARCRPGISPENLSWIWVLTSILVLASIFLGAAQAAPALIEERNSTYNNIYVYQDGSYVMLTFGHNRRFYTESVYDTTDELALPVVYTRYMTLGLAYATRPASLLEIGFGGGRTAWYLHKKLPMLDITSAELDPVVFEMAKKYFGIRAEDHFKVEVSDGRNYMTKTNATWDIIMIDAYRGPFIPFHLLTEEFFRIVKSKLNQGGVMVQNVEPSTMMFDSAMATVRKVFGNVEIYEAGGNIVTVAYDGERRTQAALVEKAKSLQKEYRLVYPLEELLTGRRIVNGTLPGKVLTDDFAPVESLLAIERHNRKLDEFSAPPSR